MKIAAAHFTISRQEKTENGMIQARAQQFSNPELRLKWDEQPSQPIRVRNFRRKILPENSIQGGQNAGDQQGAGQESWVHFP